MRWMLGVCVMVTGCGAVIEPGHRGLMFQPRAGGLKPGVLGPGYHWVGAYGRVDDFDVTYSQKREEIHTVSSEHQQLDLQVSIRYRPVVAELYELDVEIGPNYYDEVLGPEFKSATRGVLARHSYLELARNNKSIEDEIENEVRQRIAGKHVEVSAVTLEDVTYAPEVQQSIRMKLVGEQEAARKKQQQEAEAARQQAEIQHETERAKLIAEQEITRKEKERRLAEEQASIERVQAETEAQTKLTRARAEAEAVRIMAKAHAEEKRAEAEHLTPLMVQMHAYDALSKLGGSGAQIMLGDWSRVPSFLFPGVGAWAHPAQKHVAQATTE